LARNFPGSDTMQRLRTCAGAVAMALALAASTALAAPAAEAPPRVVRDPYYGDALFYFFQQRYFTAVTGLMASQQFGRMPHHADDSELLRGGLLLSYGMHEEAGRIFEELLDRSASPRVRDRAWFYLAKIRYQRGLSKLAEEALGHIGKSLPPGMDEERVLLLANVLMARRDYAGAAAALEGLSGRPEASIYARYNLGVALIKSGQSERGTALLDLIGSSPQESEELLALRDKANVALGFSALQANDSGKARSYLERVRLNGMLSNKALLGFGWASASQKQQRDALVPWMELAGRDSADPAVLEAKLAVPYAFGELGAYAQALEHYNEAIAAFEREGANLDESIAAIRAGKLVDGLVERNPGEQMGWFWNVEHLPDFPHGAYLVQVLSQHRFQEGFKNYRDLQFLASNLHDWEQNLGVLGDMLATRRQAFADRLPQVQARERAVDINDLKSRREGLALEVDRADQQHDGIAFADAGERELIARLERVRALLAATAADPALAEARERYRRVVGAMSWRLSDQLPDRLWEARKGLGAIDKGIGEARRLDAALLQAQIDEPARFDAFAVRIAGLGRRIHDLIPRVAALQDSQREYIQELAVSELELEKERLAAYTTQARFAVAQIYDRANLERDNANAPAP
jgi:hypothetical protein